ncbi:MAG TPA: hypothetical protein VLF59_03430 [Candidatus Saccharimonadales bacterium]|nr:hypothetical protein [Candidatus Saccharimonadales bacterium]
MKKLRQRIVLFALALSVISPMLLTTASFAAGCQSPSIMFGRWKWCGYWYNRFEDTGDPVRTGGVPSSVNNVNDFINLIKGDFSGDAKHQTEAKFIIRTMLGSPYYSLPSPPQATGSTKTPTSWADPKVTQWENELKTYANISENGTTSKGQNGSIDWFYVQHLPCGVFNTYWQPTYNDIAPYVNDASNSTCADNAVKEQFIIFRNTAGSVIYTIRRPCMNPMGNLGKLSQVPLNNYTLTSNVTSSGSTAIAGGSATFTYAVGYSGSTTATGISCVIHANNHPGSISPNPPSPAETTGASPPGVSTGCPRSFSSSATLTTETVTNLPANTTVCRTLVVSPANNGAGSSADEACVTVLNEPYLSVLGGDAAAGTGFGQACSEVSAQLKSWNLNTAASNYFGAGAEVGAWATGPINNFVSGMGLATGAATRSGYPLSFANTVNIGGGNYGGQFGTGSVPCMYNYYANKPATTNLGVSPTIGTFLAGPGTAAGDYSATGTLTLGDASAVHNPLAMVLNGGKQISIYVQGSVYVASNITYAYGNLADIPRLNIYVSGDIYIDPHVTEMHGVYIAQKNGAGTGMITTCATGAAATTLPYATCNTQLKVVGTAAAEGGLRLNRTWGNLVAAPGVANTPAETFQYSPEMWLSAPTAASGKIQSYTSLPPVL